jgi:hypothetical protein
MEIILFIDHVGFNIVAEKIEETKDFLKVKNPAVLQASPNQQNQLQVQMLPVLFKEFIEVSSRDEGAVFTYLKNNIVTTNANLESRLRQQYTQMFGLTQPASENTGPSPDIIKLFDE